MSDNKRRYWDAARAVPDYAKKEIRAGKLKGYSNINPQWRLEKLTEMFGPAGFGWKLENVSYWTSEGVNECVMWCSLDLRVCENGTWSEPINGIGGSKLYGKGQGDGINDEAAKMAQTDAISVACKNLGIAADVYMGLDDTKYRAPQDDYSWGARPAATTPPAPPAPPKPRAQKNAPAGSPEPAPATAPPVPLEVIQEAKDAKSTKELILVWNKYKKLYGTDTNFKKAVADNPNNPSKI